MKAMAEPRDRGATAVRATEASAPSPQPISQTTPPISAIRWYLKLLLLLVSVALLTLSFAPFKQFYLAWVGLAPMLLVWREARSLRSAIAWGWCAGVLFFTANLSYLVLNTIPGTIALVGFESLFWAGAAAIIWAAPSATRLIGAALATAVTWVAFDWLRGNTIFALPWLYFGYTQSPAPVLCQVADCTGVYGVTFCIVLVNALLVPALRAHTRQWRLILPAWGAAAVLIGIVIAYGAYRLSEDQTYPGPRVLVVQPNDPMTRGGSKSVTQEQSLQFHLSTTLDALEREKNIDLIVWSETTMPPLNSEARDALHNYSSGPFLEKVHSALRGLAVRADAGLLAGGYYVGGWKEAAGGGGKRGTDIRNAAFFYARTGEQQGRYDKIHLMPFGEFIPYRDTIPGIGRVLHFFGPYHDEYTLNPGSALTVLSLSTRDASAENRFVTPICFDDLDAPLMARMFRPDTDATAKRAEFIVNLTNDGWFRWFEPQQHLQAAVFRSIENRVPTARSVNTGVSGFIDSGGRVQAIISPGTAGTLAQNLALDRRVTFYTRFGDCFAIACIIGCASVVAINVQRRARAWRTPT